MTDRRNWVSIFPHFCCHYKIVKANLSRAHNKWTFFQFVFIFPLSVISFSFHSYATRRLCSLRLSARCSKPPSFPLRSHRPEISEQFFIFNQLCTHHIVVVIIILWYLLSSWHGGKYFSSFSHSFCLCHPIKNHVESSEWKRSKKNVFLNEKRSERGERDERLVVEGEQGLIESWGPYR